MGREHFAVVLEKNDLTSRGTPNTIMADSFPGCGRRSCRPVCCGLIQDTESFCSSQHHLRHASIAFTTKKRNGIDSGAYSCASCQYMCQKLVTGASSTAWYPSIPFSIATLKSASLYSLRAPMVGTLANQSLIASYVTRASNPFKSVALPKKRSGATRTVRKEEQSPRSTYVLPRVRYRSACCGWNPALTLFSIKSRTGLPSPPSRATSRSDSPVDWVTDRQAPADAQRKNLARWPELRTIGGNPATTGTPQATASQCRVRTRPRC